MRAAARYGIALHCSINAAAPPPSGGGREKEREWRDRTAGIAPPVRSGPLLLALFCYFPVLSTLLLLLFVGCCSLATSIYILHHTLLQPWLDLAWLGLPCLLACCYIDLHIHRTSSHALPSPSPSSFCTFLSNRSLQDCASKSHTRPTQRPQVGNP